MSVIDAARLAVCRLDASAVLPDWLADRRGFVSVTRTTEELSIICPDELVPPDVRCERGFSLLKVEGPLPFDAVGIIARLAGVLAAAQISLIAVGTSIPTMCSSRTTGASQPSPHCATPDSR